MKNKTLIVLIAIIIVTGLYFLGNFLLTPKYGEDHKNPYDLKLDSIGIIEKDKYCNYNSTGIYLNLVEAKAIAIDKFDNIYISGDNKIQILDKNGTVADEFSTTITATALTSSEDKLITGMKDHIEIFNLNGEQISRWKSISSNSYITSIVKIKEKIYAADADAELIYVFNEFGEITGIFGDSVPPNSNMRFVLPSYYFDVAKDPEGFLWVSNTGKHKLVNLHASGELRSYWGKSSAEVEGFCGCCNPTHFTIMQDGSFITSEKGIIRIKKYDAAGQFVCAIAGPDQFKKRSEGLDIALDSKQNIYVLEPEAMLLHIFKKK